MHRSTRPFFSFQPAHRILSPLAADRLASAPCASNSRSHKSIDSLASDSDAPGSRTGNNRRDKMMADSRPESPTWDELPSNMVPLLSIGNRAMGGSAAPTRSHTLLSRTPSPYPPMAGADIGASGSNLNAARLNLGPRSDFDKGKLGWWMWNTQRGWIFLVGLLVAFYAGSGLMRLIQNQFILRTGVYK